MKYSIFLICFFCVLSCTNQIEESKEELPLPYSPYFSLSADLDIEQFEIDTFNIFEFGDCWGSTYKFNNNNQSLVIDSMTCSEYGFYFSRYFLENDEIKLAHIQESTTLIGSDTQGPQYVLKEEIYDFQNEKKYFINSDTLSSPDFNLLDTEYEDFSHLNLKNKIVNLKERYKGIWTRNGK